MGVTLFLYIYCIRRQYEFFAHEIWEPYSKHDWLVCVCVRTMCRALAGQCSVQCRSEQRRPRPGQPQYPGNPCVFRSPGPYLMSLSKKKVALSRAFLSHCLFLSITLLFPLFFSCSLLLPVPWSHFANEWIPSVYSATLLVPLHFSGFHQKEEENCHQRPPQTLGFHLTQKWRIC